MNTMTTVYYLSLTNNHYQISILMGLQELVRQSNDDEQTAMIKLFQAIEGFVDPELADKLEYEFVILRQDLHMGIPERVSAGKLIDSVFD